MQNQGTTSVTLSKSAALLFDEKSPAELVSASSWSWHDSPHSWLEESVEVPADCLTVITFNGRSSDWGVGTKHAIQLSGQGDPAPFVLDPPEAWLSAVTFLSVDRDGRSADTVFPNQIVVHVENAGSRELELKSLRLWLPDENSTYHVFRRSREFTRLDRFPTNGMADGPGKAGFVISCDPLPLGYVVVEVRVTAENQQEQSLWGHLRIKREVFDISGGWIASDIGGRNSLTVEEYLKTLCRMHINTGQIEEVSGYTDNLELYRRYPFKRFNRMQDLSRYDTEEMLPTIHAVEFIGEPQYGGGRPIPPQEVWELLAPYQPSRLPTSVTLSEERTWRYYAGLSDYPHYDAYRVIAPAADSWGGYDRWDGERIRWGAPLETIGDMTRSLRQLSRPRPIAYSSQGAHDGWGGRWSSRRGSPTPDELRSQAWHGLANRVTSLYWFNLSLKSLVKFPDLIEPITRVNREIRMVEDVLLSGDAFEYRRVLQDGKTSWDLNSVASPHAALLVAHDLAYRPDPDENVFRFEPRTAKFEFTLPGWLGSTPRVFAVDADGTHDVPHSVVKGRVTIQDQIDVVGIYIATDLVSVRQQIDLRQTELVRQEQETSFDPANNEHDLRTLKSFLETTSS